MKLAQKKKSIVLSDILAYNQLYWCSVFISLLGGFPSGGPWVSLSHSCSDCPIQVDPVDRQIISKKSTAACPLHKRFGTEPYYFS